jgi:hypothetical protein
MLYFEFEEGKKGIEKPRRGGSVLEARKNDREREQAEHSTSASTNPFRSLQRHPPTASETTVIAAGPPLPFR